MSSWSCGYVRTNHTLAVSEDQSNTGSAGVRLVCLNKPLGRQCEHEEAVYAPHAKAQLERARQAVQDVILGSGATLERDSKS